MPNASLTQDYTEPSDQLKCHPTSLGRQNNGDRHETDSGTLRLNTMIKMSTWNKALTLTTISYIGISQDKGMYAKSFPRGF